MSNLAKYGSYDLDAANEEQEELDKSGSGADFMKLEAGRNVVRFLPPAPGKRTPFLVTYQHFIKLPGQDNMVFTCPRMMQRQPCPACAEAERLKATGNPADADLASGLFARRRVFANVIDRANPEKGPRIVGFGKTVHEQLVALRTDEDAGGDYTHPIEGFDIIIERVGTSKNDTKYTVRPARQTSQLASTEEQIDNWISIQHNLDQFTRIPSKDELARMFSGVPSTAAPAGRSRPTGGARRPSAQDDAIDTTGEEA